MPENDIKSRKDFECLTKSIIIILTSITFLISISPWLCVILDIKSGNNTGGLLKVFMLWGWLLSFCFSIVIFVMLRSWKTSHIWIKPVIIFFLIISFCSICPWILMLLAVTSPRLYWNWEYRSLFLLAEKSKHYILTIRKRTPP